MPHELMALRSTTRNVPVSSEDEENEDPLESLLTGMNLGRYHHKSRSFFPSVLFVGIICITLGFAIGYISFLIIDETKFPPMINLPGVNHDVSYLLDKIKIPNIDERIREIGNISRDSEQIKYINNYFLKQGLETVISSINVVATIRGIQEPDRLVVLSARRSTSGALLELARVFSTLRPYRSILFCAWNQEIPDKWLQLLDRNIVAIVDVDWSDNSFALNVSPLLSRAISETSVNTSSVLINLKMNHLGIPSVNIVYNGSHKSAPQVNEPLIPLWTSLTWSLVATNVMPLRAEGFADFLSRSYPESEGTLYYDALKNVSFNAQHFDEELKDLSKTNDLAVRIKNDVLINLEKSCLHRSNETEIFHCVQHSNHVLQGDFLPLQDENKKIV